jgi:hypothetical protein
MKGFGAGHRPNHPSEVILLGVDAHAETSATRWGLLLVLFMRMIAALWMLQGLMQWDAILGPGETPLDALPSALAIAIVFFAVTDLVAAVGLWLAASWGGVIWLCAAAAQIFVTLFMPDFFAGGPLILAVDQALIVGYFVLTWRAAQERDF